MNEVFDLAAQIRLDMGDTDRTLTATQQKVLALEKDLKSLEKTGATTSNKIGAAERSLEQQRKAADSLQRQRSAAIISNWKKEEAAAKKAASTMASEMEKAAVSAEKDVTGALSSIAPQFGALASAGGPIGLAVAAIALVGAASIGAGAGIYSMVASSAEATARFKDLNQQTGFSVETLSTLEQAAITSGGSIETVAASLGIFQRHMEEANEGNKESIRIFKTLNIDIHDNEKALRQAFDILSSLQPGAQQTALSMKLFGRSGREVMAIFKEAGGDINAFTERLRAMGILITTETAEAGDKLSDSITILGQKINAVGRDIASQFAPMVIEGLSTFSNWLKDNQKEIVNTAREVARLVSDIKDMASFIYSISPIRLTVEIFRVAKDVGFDEPDDPKKFNPNYGGDSYFTRFKKWMGDEGVGDVSSWRAGLGQSPTASDDQMKKQGQAFKKQQDADAAKADAERKKKEAMIKGLGKGGGGGKKGGGGGDPAAESKKLTEIALKSTLDSYREQEDALKRSLAMRWTSLQQFTQDSIDLEVKRHEAVLRGLDTEAEAAKRLKKGSAVALAEIDLKRKEEQRTYTEDVSKLFDSFNENQIEQTRSREEGILRIKEVTAQTEKEKWQKLADDRVITTDAAVELIGDIEQAGMKRRMEFLHAEMERAGADRKAQIDVQMQMGELEAEMAAAAIRNEQEASRALHERLVTQRSFNAELERTTSALQIQTLELEKQKIQHALDVFGSGRGRGRAADRQIASIDLKEENLRAEAAKRELFLKLLTDMEGKNYEERTKLYEVFIANRDAIDAQHTQAIQEIQDRELQAARVKAEQMAGSLTSIIDRALTEGFSHGMKAGLVEFVNGILDMIRSRVLQNLEESIADAIMSGIMKGQQGSGGGGGGGILGMLFGVLMGGLSGGFGFGASHMIGPGSSFTPGGTGLVRPRIVGHAEGGPVFAGIPVMVGDRADKQPEIFMPRSNGHIFTQDQFRSMMGNQRGGPSEVHNHYHNWNVQTPNPASFMGRDTQAQITRQASRAINVSKVRTGG